MYAVIATGGKQYRVEKDGVLQDREARRRARRHGRIQRGAADRRRRQGAPWASRCSRAARCWRRSNRTARATRCRSLSFGAASTICARRSIGSNTPRCASPQSARPESRAGLVPWHIRKQAAVPATAATPTASAWASSASAASRCWPATSSCVSAAPACAPAPTSAIGTDHTLFALKHGRVQFQRRGAAQQMYVSVQAAAVKSPRSAN